MELLRLITAGSVDDGKSTLIGRLLYDSKNIWIDQIEQLEKVSKARKTTQIDLALLTDGLRAEREQGITIDVAYRYFSSPLRKFIIADAIYAQHGHRCFQFRIDDIIDRCQARCDRADPKTLHHSLFAEATQCRRDDQ